MVPCWNMLTAKRIGLQQKSPAKYQSNRQKLKRLLDYLRLWYPLKLDFCRMTIDELTSIMERVIREDKGNPSSYKPVVAIGHTKDLVDFDSVEYFLSYLGRKGIAVSTFKEALHRCKR